MAVKMFLKPIGLNRWVQRMAVPLLLAVTRYLWCAGLDETLFAVGTVIYLVVKRKCRGQRNLWLLIERIRN
jgi:hypothetical protein